MDRINTPSAGPNVNGMGKRGWVDQNLAEGREATQASALFFNGIQEEFMSIIEDAGLQPDATQQSQVLAAINAKIASATGSESLEGITAAKTRSASARPDFIRPTGTANSATIQASLATPLVLGSRGAVNRLEADVLLENLPASPVSNNTFQLAGITTLGPLTGEIGTVDIAGSKHGEIPMARAGSEITGRVGQEAAFKITLGRVTEYFIGKIASSTKLSNVQRRFFLNPDGDPYGNVSGAVSSIGSVTLMGLIHVMRDLTNNEFVAIPSTKLTEGPAQPGSPSNDDLWLNTVNMRWNRYRNSQFEEIDLARCGYLVMDGANCLASRSFDISQNYSTSNNLEVEVRSDDSLQISSLDSIVSVYGTIHKFLFGGIWGAASLAPGVSISASSKYFLYVTERGSLLISDVAPQWSKQLKGFYNPYESWRAVGEAFTDASSDFTEAVNHFMWERYALHGVIPEIESYYYALSVNVDNPVSSFLSSILNSDIGGTSGTVLNFKTGLFTEIPSIVATPFQNTTRAWTAALFTPSTSQVGVRSGVEGSTSSFVRRPFCFVIGFSGLQLKQVQINNTLKRQ